MPKLSKVFDAYERRRQEILAEGGGDVLRESRSDEPRGSAKKRSGPGSERSFSHQSRARAQSRSEDPIEPDADDFGDEPDEFVDKDMSYASSSDDESGEFRGAPADPVLAPGFEDEPDGADFGGEPVFGDVPEPIVDPEAGLWHGNIGWEDDETGSSGSEHRTSVKFPDYEGPKHRSAHHPEDEPDEKGFYPRSQSSKKKR